MLSFSANWVRNNSCSRRRFLSVGSLLAGGLSLPRFLASAAQAETSSSTLRDKAIIQIFLCGGPSIHDTFDPKPEMPAEIRGPFSPIATKLPGVFVTELFPRLAALLDRCSLVRSVRHGHTTHHMSYHWMQTGYLLQNFSTTVSERPSIGAAISHLCGANAPGLPAYVTIPRASFYGGAAYLGMAHEPFGVGDPNDEKFSIPNLHLPAGLTDERIPDRRRLLTSLDRFRRDLDARGEMTGIDEMTRAAFELVTGPAAREAFDVSDEDPRLKERYGKTRIGQSCLLARRLVEAGVKYVTYEDFELSEWDLHGVPAGALNTESGMKLKGPHLDAALGTLIEDLEDRGLLDHVLIAVYGEFGRTPRLNGMGGRDHWGDLFNAMFIGGGLRAGQVVGASNSRGEYPTERPVGPEDILATMYHTVGIDASRTFVDYTGRPVSLVPDGEVIHELV